VEVVEVEERIMDVEERKIDIPHGSSPNHSRILSRVFPYRLF
jgi:hypothetical protein